MALLCYCAVVEQEHETKLVAAPTWNWSREEVVEDVREQDGVVVLARMTGGSDAHLEFEIGRGRTIVNSEAKEASKKGRTKKGEESNYYLVHGLSVGMEKIKGVMK